MNAHNISRFAPELISVIIPTLNEVANIAQLLTRLDRILTNAAIPYEVIVVDDHSTDGTTAAAEAITIEKELPVRILTKQGQPGKSFSLMEGFAAASFDVLAMIDADLHYAPESLLDMIGRLEDADVILFDKRTNRLHSGRPVRKALGRLFAFVISMLFGIESDVQSGLKEFRRRVLEGMTAMPRRWSFDHYLVKHAFSSGYAIANVPVVPNQRQASTRTDRLRLGSMALMIDALRLKACKVFVTVRALS